MLDQNSLSTIKRKTNRLRGGEAEDDDGEILPIDGLGETEETEPAEGARGSRRRYESYAETSLLPEPEDNEDDEDDSDSTDIFEEFDPSIMNVFHLSAVPGVSLVGFGSHSSLFSLGLVGAYDENVYAVQHSTFFNIASSRANGIQLAGLFNIAGEVNGVQVSGLFNTAGNVNGAQVSGLFNAGKRVSGGQVTGLVNVAQEIDGIQVSGLVNAAREVSGAQIGVINYAEKSDGVALGVINIIKDGMHHIGFNWDTNDMIDTFFQTGTKNLFMTFGTAMDRSYAFSEKSDDKDENKTVIVYGGFGTEFRFSFSSIDIEFLYKWVYDKDSYPKDEKAAKNFDYSAFTIPSFRFTYNALSMRHVDLSLGASFDIRDPGQNDKAFECTRHRFKFDDDDSTIYPALFLGVKIK